MRYETLKERAKAYAHGELGWEQVVAVAPKPAGDGRAVAVLMHVAEDEEALRIHPTRFVIVFDEWDEIVTDAGEPEDFGFTP